MRILTVTLVVLVIALVTFASFRGQAQDRAASREYATFRGRCQTPA
jgi:hypothetical protein